MIECFEADWKKTVEDTILTISVQGVFQYKWNTWEEAVESGQLHKEFIGAYNIEEDWHLGFLGAMQRVPSQEKIEEGQKMYDQAIRHTIN